VEYEIVPVAKKMSKVVDLCQESNDGEWPNTASCPSLQFLGKRPRGREELSYNAYPRNENGPGNKTTIGLASFVFDLEVADEVVVSQYRKRRGAIIGKPSGKNAAVGKCVQILKGVNATEKDVDAQVVDHRASHEGVTLAAASHPMNSDSEQASECVCE
jgi:acetyltransferase-like isoleucine patch superfamily enzyme